MNEKTFQLEENRTTKVYLLLAISFSVVGWILYLCFGHMLVKAMYEGRAVSILSNLVKYQHKKPVEHYQSLADFAFYLGLLVLCLVLFIQKSLSILLSFANRRQWLSSDSVLHIKIVFLISFCIRIFFLPWAWKLVTVGDEKYYWNYLPNRILSGNFAGTVERPPVWGYMMLIPHAISSHPIAGRIFCTLVGSFVPVLLYFLAARILDKRKGFFAALLMAVYPTHIGYSHYLWSEVFFGALCLLSVYFFFGFVKDQQKTKYLILSFCIAGIALITKEFAVILFSGLVVTLCTLQVKNKFKKVFTAAVIFVLPMLVYSFVISTVINKVVVLNTVYLSNLREGVGLSPDYKGQLDDRKKLFD